MQGGLSKEDATEVVLKKVPRAGASVPIYDEWGTETLRRHLLVKLEIEIDQQSVSGQPQVNQPSIAAAFRR